MDLRSNIRYKVRYKGDKIIFVSPTKILDRLEQDSPSFSIRGGKNQIGNRVQRAKEYIIKNWNNPDAKKLQRYQIFEPSVVGIYNGIISFGDGRHRILAAEELGIPEVAVEIPRNQEHLFDYMKVKPESISESISKSKINESPDYIDDYQLSYMDPNTIPFISDNNGNVVNIGQKSTTHSSVLSPLAGEFNPNYSGRLWMNKKTMSFWTYPNRKTFIKIINKLQKLLNFRNTEPITSFWNNDWKIEVVLINDEIITDQHTRFKFGNETIKIIPIEDYLKGENFSDEERQLHLMNSTEKDMLRKAGKDPLKYYKSLGKEKPLAYKQAIYQEKVSYEDVKSKFKNDMLLPLKRESLKYENFKDFSNSYSIYGNHGLYFHLTSNPNWFYNPEIGSKDMSSMAGGYSEKGSLMVTSDLENWDWYYNFDEDENPKTKNTRNYVALIDLGDVKYHVGFGRGFGHELYIYPNEAKKVIILDVLPINEARNLWKKWKKIQPQSEKELYKLWKNEHKSNESIITKFQDFENNI